MAYSDMQIAVKVITCMCDPCFDIYQLLHMVLFHHSVSIQIKYFFLQEQSVHLAEVI